MARDKISMAMAIPPGMNAAYGFLAACKALGYDRDEDIELEEAGVLFAVALVGMKERVLRESSVDEVIDALRAAGRSLAGIFHAHGRETGVLNDAA